MLKHRYAAAGLLMIFCLVAAPLSRALPLAGVARGARAGDSPTPVRRASYPARPARPIDGGLLSHLAVGAKVSTLGIGITLATPMGRHFNVRGAADFFHYNDNLTASGVHFQAHLSFTSAEAHLDWYPWGRSFHISPGALVYTNNHLWGAGGVPGGDSFSLNNANYVSSRTDPVHGDAQVAFAHFAPMLTVGWGNPIPRSGRRWSIPFEMGFAYVGEPTVKLDFAGTVCDSTGTHCEPVSQYPEFQTNLNAERQKLQKDANYARFLPVISIGYSYRF